MLLCVSLSVYGLLAWLMPQTYSNRLNIALNEQAQEFISELEQVAFSDSGGLFDQFVQGMGINTIALVNNCVGFGLSPFYGTQKVVVYDYLM